jgi:anti-anti-sigma regulatory factor
VGATPAVYLRIGVAMELRDAVLGDVPMLVADGTIEDTTCGALQAALRRLLESRHNIVFLDLSNVTHVDNAGLSVLLDWVQALRGRGWLGLIGPDTNVRRFLEDEGFLVHPNVRVFATRQAALVATGERQST